MMDPSGFLYKLTNVVAWIVAIFLAGCLLITAAKLILFIIEVIGVVTLGALVAVWLLIFVWKK